MSSIDKLLFSLMKLEEFKTQCKFPPADFQDYEFYNSEISDFSNNNSFNPENGIAHKIWNNILELYWKRYNEVSSNIELEIQDYKEKIKELEQKLTQYTIDLDQFNKIKIQLSNANKENKDKDTIISEKDIIIKNLRLKLAQRNTILNNIDTMLLKYNSNT
jgi:hypothetical protein